MKANKDDPMEMLFGNTRSVHGDAGSTLPQQQQHNQSTAFEHELDESSTHEELRYRVTCMLKKSTLDADERQCLEQVLSLVQQLDALLQRSGSGPNSLNTNSSSSSGGTSSSSDNSSMDLVKSHGSDYSSASLASGCSSGHSNSYESCATSFRFSKWTAGSCSASPTHGTGNNGSGSRIIATVSPYNSTQTTTVIAPTNTPVDSPRKQRSSWQCNSLSESGVFVESDFLSDTSENLNACTQTDFDRLPLTPQRSTLGTAKGTSSPSSDSSYQKRLQYYKERLAILENKVLIYESSGDLQAKRLADRLQREIQLEKELRELQDRVDFLEGENLTLEEEKCEFEEAENDTRLRLQRLEVDLEILSQRNVELEMSREALSAKYKDCRSECLILRDDLSVSETQIRHLEEDKQKAKENLEFLHSTLPLFLICNTLAILGDCSALTETQIKEMGNVIPQAQAETECASPSTGGGRVYESNMAYSQDRELHCLREEVKRLRHQIKELNSRHYEALESADSHWVDLEREYKDREEASRAKEYCLKQKIQKLQDCLRDDARAANEKILQLEEAEKELKCCLIRVSKEHREIIDEHANVIAEYERFKEKYEQLQSEQKPLSDALEAEKKRNKCLSDEVHFMQRLQQETESRSTADLEALRSQLNDLRKEFLHIEVTNGELKEEVATLEQQLEALQLKEKDYVDKIRCLSDEVRTKEEMCQKLEKQLERSEGFSLAQELGGGSPSKRFKREDITDLRSATKGLGSVLRNIKKSEVVLLPTHQQFQSVARDVKKLADSLLKSDGLEEEVSEPQITVSKKSCLVVKESDFDLDDPMLASTPIKKRSLESGVEYTVGMTLVPDIIVDDKMMPTFSGHDENLMGLLKKPICEVPSELRKLSTVNENSPSMPKKGFPQIRLPYKRFYSYPNMRVQNQRKRRFSSCSSARRCMRIFRDLDDLECQSEIMTHRLSYESFYSLLGDENTPRFITNTVKTVPPAKVDASTDMGLQHVDKMTEIYIELVESSVQVDDEVSSVRHLDILPVHLREFLNVLKASLSVTDDQIKDINICILERWQADAEFREYLELLQSIAASKFTNRSKFIENYEFFVSAMSGLNMLQEVFKPLKVPLLQEIEEQINEELMNFHTRKMESEFYCTVYYPVKRQVSLDVLKVPNY